MTSRQAPLGSGFGAQSTARDALRGIDLTGKVAIVTGGYSGIGTETTRALSEAGATVIVPARDPKKAASNLQGIARVEQETLDLEDPASIDAFAARFVGSGRPLDILVNSAGVMAIPELSRDARGYERQFATNHLGHFQLAARLWPALVKAKAARVVAVSSRGHRYGTVDLGDPFYERRAYEKFAAYGQSKTANILFALALDRRGEPHGIRAFSLHPGAIYTDLARHLTNEDLTRLGVALDENGERLPQAGYKTPEQGAATQVWAATSPQLANRGGIYLEDCEVANPVPADNTGTSGVWPWGVDAALAEELWKASERWTVPFTV